MLLLDMVTFAFYITCTNPCEYTKESAMAFVLMRMENRDISQTGCVETVNAHEFIEIALIKGT